MSIWVLGCDYIFVYHHYHDIMLILGLLDGFLSLFFSVFVLFHFCFVLISWGPLSIVLILILIVKFLLCPYWFTNLATIYSTSCSFQQNMAAYQNLITQSMYDKQLDSGKGTLLHLCDDVIQQEVSCKLYAIFWFNFLGGIHVFRFYLIWFS